MLITNPAAARTTEEGRRTVGRVFEAAGWTIEHVITQAPGDARRLATEAVNAHFDSVVVFGGDGTTMQAAAALVGSDVALGLIPGGTGNLLAGNLRIPGAPVPAARMIAEGRSRRIDLARVQRPDGVHYFAVAGGAGADARIMGETESDSKRRWGIGGYFATLFRVLPEIRSIPYRITVDGEAFVTPAAVALVLNCGELIPPLFPVRRGVRLDDGVLDVVAVAVDSPWGAARGILRVVQNLVLDTGSTRYLMYARGREVTIAPDEVQPVQFDGDTAGTTPFTATVVPGAIRVMAPDGR
jgi:diacylglycerol kinase family enzyme